MLIGRKKEIEVLKKITNDDSSHFTAVYGRRRIGKTFLIRETFSNRFTFQHSGLFEGTMREQLFSFTCSLKEYGMEIEKPPLNWLEAFEYLKQLIRNSSEKKKIIFLDELSWMDTSKSDFMLALENFWNSWASARKDIVFIVCASATSWIMSKVINNKGGLYNRLTEQIHLDQFSLKECEDYVKENNLSLNRESILQGYMVFGGVPYYWSLLQKGLSLAQNINSLFFEKNAPLKTEFKYLYASIFKNPHDYYKIIIALSQRNSGLTREEIISEAKLDNSGNTSQKLDNLENCGFIRKAYTFGIKHNKAVYQLIDCFTLFYLYFFADYPTDEHFWTNQINTPKINTWEGFAFERVCFLHIQQIKQKLGINGILTQTNSWHCKANKEEGIFGSQIDLLIDRKDQVINLCEMKYCNSDYSISSNTYKSLQKKISDLRSVTKTKSSIQTVLITTYGLLENSNSQIVQNVVTMDDLFI